MTLLTKILLTIIALLCIAVGTLWLTVASKDRKIESLELSIAHGVEMQRLSLRNDSILRGVIAQQAERALVLEAEYGVLKGTKLPKLPKTPVHAQGLRDGIMEAVKIK